MRKKYIRMLLILGLFCLGLSSVTQTAVAEEDTSLISELFYDKDNHVLTGKTVPNANISLADIVATISADDDGNFSVPIPEELEKTTITIMDFLNDQSTDINYDFVAATVATEEPVAQSTANGASQASSTTQSSQKTANSVTQTDPPKKEGSLLIWVVVLVVIVVLTILVIFLFNKRKADKVAAEQAAKEASRSGRRKKRRKKPTE